MTDFLDKLESASKEFKELINNTATKDNNFGRAIYLAQFNEPVRILENIFFQHKNNLYRHLVNYFKLMIKKMHNRTLDMIEYWLFRSAIASLSKYINPSIEILMTQHYESAYDILINSFQGESLDMMVEQKEVIDALFKIKDNTTNKVGYIGDEVHVEKCKEIISKTIEKITYNIKEINQISIESIFDTFSFEIIKTMINESKSEII